VSSNENYAKLRQKGSCGGHVNLYWNFGTPNISGMVKAKNFKFGMETEAVNSNGKNAKLPQKG